MNYLAILLMGNAILFTVLLLGQIIYRTKVHGSKYALGNLDAEQHEWCESRLIRVKNNQQETLILVVTLVVLASLLTVSSSQIITALCLVHLMSRVIYISLALRGVPVARSITWTIGLGCLAGLLIEVMN